MAAWRAAVRAGGPDSGTRRAIRGWSSSSCRSRRYSSRTRPALRSAWRSWSTAGSSVANPTLSGFQPGAAQRHDDAARRERTGLVAAPDPSPAEIRGAGWRWVISAAAHTSAAVGSTNSPRRPAAVWAGRRLLGHRDDAAAGRDVRRRGSERLVAAAGSRSLPPRSAGRRLRWLCRSPPAQAPGRAARSARSGRRSAPAPAAPGPPAQLAKAAGDPRAGACRCRRGGSAPRGRVTELLPDLEAIVLVPWRKYGS